MKFSNVLKIILLTFVVGFIYLFGPDISDENKFKSQKTFGNGPSIGQNVIFFKKIDNVARVYMNDSMIFDSRQVEFDPAIGVEFDYETFLSEGLNEVRVDLINMGHDPWEIIYEIYYDGALLDFLSERSRKVYADSGVVVSHHTEISQ